MSHPQLLGLIELDRTGTVLYARFEKEDVRRDLSGLNFFSEVAPFRNVEAFRRRLDEFVNGPDQANIFNFICDFTDGQVPVRVLIARISERTNGDLTESILIHIRHSHEFTDDPESRAGERLS